MAVKFKVNKDKRGEYASSQRAQWRDDCRLEGYRTKSSAKKGIESVKKYAGAAAVDDESGDEVAEGHRGTLRDGR